MSYDSTIGILPVDLSFGSDIGFGFLTNVERTAAGREYRDTLREYELGRWVARYDARKGRLHREMLAFLRAARGRRYSFRAKDPTDYTVSQSEGKFVATSDATKWQMVKRYTTKGGATYDRKITKPGDGATSQAGSVDAATGLVTHGGMPTYWETPLFYVQVRFDEDELVQRILTRNGSDGDLIVAYEIPVVEVDE